MRALGKITKQLNAMRRNLAAVNINSSDDGRLEPMTGFGSNPGGLDCRVYVPATAPKALVVILHGCTQSASVYDEGSGWSKLAERHGFAVMYPQQRRANNPNLCFNWYEPSDARRGQGEALSISQMVKTMAKRHGLDRSQVFISGLSAGGAMTAVMLACYPELFAAGAIIAGLPFGTADTLSEALERMRGQAMPARADLAALVEGAGDFEGAPPTISVWHGTDDNIVDPSNSDAIVKQWLEWHGLGKADASIETVAGHARKTWPDDRGMPVVESYSIRGMGHGTPVKTGDREACGKAGPHMLETSICSTREIAQSWCLVSRQAGHVSKAVPAPVDRASASPGPRAPVGVGAVIEEALRSAGLMR